MFVCVHLWLSNPKLEVMSIYIVRPKTSSITRSLTLMSRKLTPQSRVVQAREVIDFWEKDSVYQEIRRWIDDNGVTQIAKQDTVITGTALVKMSQEQAEEMRQELPNAEVLPDQRIELIRPLRDESSTKAELAESDLCI